MRARDLRRLHRAPRRRRGARLLPARGSGGRGDRVDRRVARGQVRADTAAGGVPAAPRAPVRVLHAGDPHGRDRPPRRGGRRRATRSSTCSPATSAAARAMRRSSTPSWRPPAHEPRRVAPRRLRASPRARGLPRDPVRRPAPAGAHDRRRPGRRSRRPRGARPRQPARDRAPLLGVSVGRGGRGAALVAALRGRARLLHRGLRRRDRHPRGRSAARRPRAPRRARSRRAGDLAAPLHLRDDGPTEGRPSLARAPTARARGRRRSSTAMPGATGRSA